MRVSVIFTVLNEATALPHLLDSLAAQSRPPDEVVACDGGSRDNTVALLRAERRFPLRVIEAPGANISRGRNLAIAAAQGDVVACTDAGVRLDPDWLEQLTRFWSLDFGFSIDEDPTRQSQSSIANLQSPISNHDSPIAKIQNPQSKIPTWVGGFFVPDPHNAFEIAMSATVLPALRDIAPARFLPSSRSVAYSKAAWAQVGGYPEWLDYCEDLIFDLNLRAAFGPCAFAPDARVYFRPRGSLRAFFKQYYLYARGDGKANLWLKRHLARYVTYGVALPALLGGIAFLPGMGRWASLALLALGAIVYTRTPYRRLREAWGVLSAPQKLHAASLIPVIRVVGDIAKMLGYPVGVWWRLRHRAAARRAPDSPHAENPTRAD
jgi:glycosyltransferase involved in cell wall biosynthesis